MDVINKLYSSVSQSVSSTVSQLSGVLPGNPVTREYEVLDQIATAGIGLLWKVYNGYKKTTKQEVSIFVFEKKQLERWPKDDKEMMIEILKRGISQLTKIRHPHVLTVQHPLEESRESLAFATEPVKSSLANLLQSNNTDPSTKELFDVEIKHGILQLCEGLIFLHTDVKIIHRNICPESIIVSKHGNWKIFGFDFCVSSQQTNDGKLYWPHQEYNSTLHKLTQPSLEYSAPEIALNSVNIPESDLFSLGMLIYSVYSDGKPLRIFGKDYSSFRRFASELNAGKYPNLSNIPADLASFLKRLLHPSPEHRPKLQELAKISFFDDIGVKTLTYLDSLYQWDNLQKSKFYKGLPQIIPTLPHRVNMQSVLPCLVKEFVNSPMIPFVLPNVLLISETCSKKEFIAEILPNIKPIMKLQEPIQILLIFMKNMDLMLKLTPADEVKLHVFPMVYRALECDMHQVQELCLGILPTFSSLIDYNTIKNALLPRIKKLCLNTSNTSLKVNCLICIANILENLDKWLVLDEILPFLTQIQSREPAVVMAIVGIYKIAMTNAKLGITKEVMATKIIPFLMPLCIENGLTIQQFNSIVALLKDMINRVETEHRVKLEQLASIQKEAGTVNTSDAINQKVMLDSKPHLEDIFANVKIDPPPGYTVPCESQSLKEQKQPSQFINASNNAGVMGTNLNQADQKQIYNADAFDKSSHSLSKISTGFLNSQSSSNFFKPQQYNQSNSISTLNTSKTSWSPQVSSFNNLSTKGSNNVNSLDSLDPLVGIRNTNKISLNQISNNNNNNFDFCSMSSPLLMSEKKNENNNKNINTLSQQDILDFLN